MHNRPVLLACIVGIAVALATSACEHAEPVGPRETGVRPTFSSIQENIFSVSCALSGCHAGPNPQQGMNLSAGQAYDNLVSVPSKERPELFRVDPGAPDSSYVVHKLEGRPSIVGQQMPLGQEPLSQEKINAIRTWIKNGAPEN